MDKYTVLKEKKWPLKINDLESKIYGLVLLETNKTLLRTNSSVLMEIDTDDLGSYESISSSYFSQYG